MDALSLNRFRLVWMFWTILPLISAASAVRKQVLVLGGNGFIGSTTTTNIVEKGHNVTMLSRGNSYYDSELKIKPFISRHIVCDREKSLSLECKELTEDQMYYDVVIDFSSYSPKQMLEMVKSLAGRVGLYVFISTEAVYEVSTKNNSNPTREEEAARPISPRRRRELQKEEPYGDQKLACEELLEHQQKQGGFPFLILRLPIVIGPRDTTFRWWTYQLWVLTHEAIHYPVHIPNGVRSNLFSLVYVDDVADLITKIVDMDQLKADKIQNMTVNLAMKEHITLPRIVKDIAQYYGIDKVQHEDDDNSTWYAYPSGTKGPLDISLALQVLEWSPISWKEAVGNTCDFYHRAMTKAGYLKEKEMMLADMLENLVPDEYYKAFLLRLKQHFGETVLDGIQFEGGIPDGAPEIGTAGLDVDSGNKESAAEKAKDEL